MNRCVLSGVPEDCSRHILAKWIRLRELARLDTALCSRRLRESFLSLAYNSTTVLTSAYAQNSIGMEALLKWAVIRVARMEGIIIRGNIWQYWDLLLAYFALCGSAIHWVQIDCHRLESAYFGQEVVLEVAKWCPNLRKLNVKAGQTTVPWDNHFISLAQSCHKLSELNLDNVQLSDQGLVEALKKCECLHRLSSRGKKGSTAKASLGRRDTPVEPGRSNYVTLRDASTSQERAEFVRRVLFPDGGPRSGSATRPWYVSTASTSSFSSSASNGSGGRAPGGAAAKKALLALRGKVTNKPVVPAEKRRRGGRLEAIVANMKNN
jgi:hypothetical protein